VPAFVYLRPGPGKRRDKGVCVGRFFGNEAKDEADGFATTILPS
jgi:hypothetical protein